MNILLIEDEGLIREALVLLIRSLVSGASVQAVGDVQEADAILIRAQFDLIFLDVRLKGEDGIEWLESKKGDGLATPVVMLSNQDDRATVLRAMNAGAFGFVPKHADDPTTLRQAVEVALAGGVYLPPTIRGRARAPTNTSLRPAAARLLRQVANSDLGLSPRIYEAVYHLTQGLTNKGIGRKMSISDNVVAEYVGKAYAILGVAGRPQLMALINSKGWQLTPPD